MTRVSAAARLLAVIGAASALTNRQTESKCLGEDCGRDLAAAVAREIVGKVAGETARALKKQDFASRVTPERCAILQNTQNAVYTVPVNIGTPAKQFRLVADTGSNVLVIPGKECTSCAEGGKTLYDVSGSSTAIKTGKMSRITYGSGPVEGPLIHDTVRAIGVSSFNQSMLVMRKQKIHSFSRFSFDGIMGMGMPVSSMGVKGQDPGEDRSFFAQAGVDAFTMCFDKGPRPNGVLKLGSKRNATFMMENVIGQVHWGVKLGGLNLAGHNVEDLCDDEDGCAVIVDSGTTLMMAPKRHLVKIYASLCHFMDACVSMAGEEADEMDKAVAFQTALLTCPKEMNDLPALDFKLGANRITISRDTYIMKTRTRDLGLSNFVGGLDEPIDLSSVARSVDVCVPAFMSMRMRSRSHGPIWIFGMPLMREYTVMFNRGDGNPSVGFSKTKTCRGCGDGKMVAGLVQTAATEVIDDVQELDHEPARFSPTYIRKPKLRLFEDGTGHVRL